MTIHEELAWYSKKDAKFYCLLARLRNSPCYARVLQSWMESVCAGCRMKTTFQHCIDESCRIMHSVEVLTHLRGTIRYILGCT
jgi:hypothetical protein